MTIRCTRKWVYTSVFGSQVSEPVFLDPHEVAVHATVDVPVRGGPEQFLSSRTILLLPLTLLVSVSQSAPENIFSQTEPLVFQLNHQSSVECFSK